MDILERLIKNVATKLHENHEAEFRAIGSKVILVNEIERLTYEQCLEELAKEGEKLKFGDDLRLGPQKTRALYPGFYFIMDWPLKLKPFYIHGKDDDPRLSKSFDLQYSYLELASCGRRMTMTLRNCEAGSQIRA